MTEWTPTRSAVSVAGPRAARGPWRGAAVLLLARHAGTMSERRATFVSTMTHAELRTPLTTFRLYTDLLEAAPETTDRARYTAVLAREAERLSHLVENVLLLRAPGSAAAASQSPKMHRTISRTACPHARAPARARRAGGLRARTCAAR